MMSEIEWTGIACGPDGAVRLTKEECAAIWEASEHEKARVEADLPTEQDAIYALNRAYNRLKDFGWTDPAYAPKNELIQIIECGSTGIHSGEYQGIWPKGSWWVFSDGDVWPSRPTLARVPKKDAE